MIIRICIVEDNRGTRESLVELINRNADLCCAGAFATGEEAIEKAPDANPHVVLVDINLPGISGIECVAKLKHRMPTVELLILTTYDESSLIFESLQSGASGYLLKNMPSQQIIQAVKQVHAGGSPMSMHIARKVVAYFQGIGRRSSSEEMDKLTPREYEILAALAKGFLYKEIADQLDISMSTVRAHLHAVYAKLHVHSRTEAVVKYLRQK